MNARPRKHSAIALTNIPDRPRVKREGSKGSLRRRCAKIQDMQIMYEDTRPRSPREVITLKAIVEPMIISESSVVQSSVAMIALAGTSHPGRT